MNNTTWQYEFSFQVDCVPGFEYLEANERYHLAISMTCLYFHSSWYVKVWSAHYWDDDDGNLFFQEEFIIDISEERTDIPKFLKNVQENNLWKKREVDLFFNTLTYEKRPRNISFDRQHAIDALWDRLES